MPLGKAAFCEFIIFKRHPLRDVLLTLSGEVMAGPLYH